MSFQDRFIRAVLRYPSGSNQIYPESHRSLHYILCTLVLAQYPNAGSLVSMYSYMWLRIAHHFLNCLHWAAVWMTVCLFPQSGPRILDGRHKCLVFHSCGFSNYQVWYIGAAGTMEINLPPVPGDIQEEGNPAFPSDMHQPLLFSVLKEASASPYKCFPYFKKA